MFKKNIYYIICFNMNFEKVILFSNSSSFLNKMIPFGKQKTSNNLKTIFFNGNAQICISNEQISFFSTKITKTLITTKKHYRIITNSPLQSHRVTNSTHKKNPSPNSNAKQPTYPNIRHSTPPPDTLPV